MQIHDVCQNASTTDVYRLCEHNLPPGEGVGVSDIFLHT